MHQGPKIDKWEEELILVEIAVNSMIPTFQDGELSLKKDQLALSNNQIILYVIDNGAKRYIRKLIKHVV